MVKETRRHYVFFLLMATRLFAESQENEYKGITDPFGDPANYEFAEDEKEDKEFFHLGRYLMFGLDFGAGIFTMGLGRTAGAGFYSGVRLVYFFDQRIAIETAAHYASHLDISQFAEIDTQLVPLTVSFRYYFDTKDSPRALAVANPYIVFGPGAYLRSLKVLTSQLSFATAEGFGSNFGLNLGAGLEFNIYRRHVYLGADFRYHLVFFEDEDGIADSSGNVIIPADDRSGDYVTAVMTLTYNF